MKVAVMSNKGGVGKTTVSINLAYTLARKGLKVGLVDIDFHGPNLPIILGVSKKPEVTAYGIVPPEIDGVKVISLSMLMRKDDDPCLWSGETKRHMVLQFLGKSIIWGDLDVMVIDTPPSLGDENLIVADLVDKIVIVSTPHPASVYDIKKMLRFLGNKVAAIVLNMVDIFSYDVDINHRVVVKLRFDPELQKNPRKEIPEMNKLAEVILGE